MPKIIFWLHHHDQQAELIHWHSDIYLQCCKTHLGIFLFLFFFLSYNDHPREVGHKQIKLAYAPLQKFRARAAGVQGYAGYNPSKVLDTPLPSYHNINIAYSVRSISTVQELPVAAVCVHVADQLFWQYSLTKKSLKLSGDAMRGLLDRN